MARSVVEVRAAEDSRTVIVAVHDALDLQSAPVVRESLGEVLGQGWEVIVIDLHDVEFMDSTGLGVLIGARRRSQDAGIKLILARPGRATHRLLVMTGMHRHFKISKKVPSGAGTAA